MSLLSEIDRLYEGCVTDPDRWHPQAIADWADAVSSGDIDRRAARSIRRVIAVAGKLVAFWQASSAPPSGDWRSRVDVAVGVKAWRPQLELAEYLLESHRDEETFDVVAALFPVVRNQPFLDGVTYAEWAADQDAG